MLSLQYPLLNNRLSVKVSIKLKSFPLHSEDHVCHAIIDTGFTGCVILPSNLLQVSHHLLMMKLPYDQCPKYRRFKDHDIEVTPSAETYRGLQLGIHDFQSDFHYFDTDFISFEDSGYGVIGMKFLLFNTINLSLDTHDNKFILQPDVTQSTNRECHCEDATADVTIYCSGCLRSPLFFRNDNVDISSRLPRLQLAMTYI